MSETITAPQPLRTEPEGQALRGVAVVGLVSVAMLIANYLATYAGILAIFAGVGALSVVPGIVVALAVVPGIVIALALVISAIAQALVGRRLIVGAIVVTSLATSAVAYGILSGTLQPVSLQQDLPLNILICGLSGLTLGVFLGPWPLRIAGVLAGVGVGLVVLLVPDPVEVNAPREAQAEAKQAAEMRAAFLASGDFPVVSDLPGWSNVEVTTDGGGGTTKAVSTTGAVARVLVLDSAEDPPLDFPCIYMAQAGDEQTVGADGMPAWCVKSENQWARPDGLASAYRSDGRLVVLSTVDTFTAELAGGSDGASAEDIEALLPALRPMSVAEVEKYILPTFTGMGTPEISTPGL